MTLRSTAISFILLAALGIAQGARAEDAESSAAGAWDSRMPETRPLLFWEELKGYRLFFHPDDTEPLRRMLTIAVSHEHVLTRAWAIIRPLNAQGEHADAWLRVEGEPSPETVSIQWDGQYRGRPFPDGPYLFEIHIQWKPAEERSWKVVVLKSKDYPLFAKIGGEAVGKHPLMFRNGEFEPLSPTASFSRSAMPSLPMLARVLAPDLDGAFATAGIEVQGRRLEDLQGKPVLNSDWECLCQQELPLDSPARKTAKKVRCDWDLSSAEPGIWDLRLGLYHHMKHRLEIEPCDAPILDEDRIRVVIAP
jgi:hypothetical protein